MREVFLSTVLDRVLCDTLVFVFFAELAEREDQPGRDPVWDAHERHWDQEVPSACSTASTTVCHYACATEA